MYCEPWLQLSPSPREEYLEGREGFMEEVTWVLKNESKLVRRKKKEKHFRREAEEHPGECAMT